MKTKIMGIALLIFFLPQSGVAEEMPAFAKKFPGGLLTPDYGILTEEDLATDARTGNPRPFNPNEGSSGYYRWQCFQTRDVKPKVRTWKDIDPMGPSNVIVTMCDLETWVEQKGQFQVYAGRRAKEGTYCREFMKYWKTYTDKEKFVCLNGQYEGINPPGKNDPQVPYKHWTWNKFKTKKGCYSYFSGKCS